MLAVFLFSSSSFVVIGCYFSENIKDLRGWEEAWCRWATGISKLLIPAAPQTVHASAPHLQRSRAPETLRPCFLCRSEGSVWHKSKIFCFKHKSPNDRFWFCLPGTKKKRRRKILQKINWIASIKTHLIKNDHHWDECKWKAAIELNPFFYSRAKGGMRLHG